MTSGVVQVVLAGEMLGLELRVHQGDTCGLPSNSGKTCNMSLKEKKPDKETARGGGGDENRLVMWGCG